MRSRPMQLITEPDATWTHSVCQSTGESACPLPTSYQSDALVNGTPTNGPRWGVILAGVGVVFVFYRFVFARN